MDAETTDADATRAGTDLSSLNLTEFPEPNLTPEIQKEHGFRTPRTRAPAGARLATNKSCTAWGYDKSQGGEIATTGFTFSGPSINQNCVRACYAAYWNMEGRMNGWAMGLQKFGRQAIQPSCRPLGTLALLGH